MSANAKLSVLVVEDEILLRLDLVTYLEQAGYNVLEAGSAREAIAILEHDRSIHAVFTDIRMPGDMDGLALAKTVRERWPPTIIIICSSHAGEARGTADFHFLDKPYTPDDLLMVLDAVGEELASRQRPS